MTSESDRALVADLASCVSDAALVRIHATAEIQGWSRRELEDEMVRRGLREWVLR